MADVMMPQLGETVTEGTITRWMKGVGDAVERDEPLFEVSTDKVDSEVPSPAAGVLSEMLVPEGETVEVGVKLAVIGVVLGVSAAFGLTRLMASMLFGVKSWDPAVFVTVPLILTAVALIAVWLPATRASRLDPMQALRVE